MNSTTSPGYSEANTLAASPPAAAPLSICPLSICIVNWNARDLLAGCLASLEAANIHSWAEVIVLDNASADGSAEMVARDFAWVRLIVSDQNTGYSKGNNIAIRRTSGEFILLLNPDTVVHPGAIERMLEAARANPKIGVVGPMQFDGNGRIHYEGAVALPTVWNVLCDLTLLSRIFSRSRLFAARKMGYWDHRGDREVPAVPGSAMLVRRKVFETVGLLDERLFYAEDMDLCRRLTGAGWIVFYAGSAAIVHYGGGSTSTAKQAGLQRQIAFQSLWVYLHNQGTPLSAAALSVVIFCWAVAAKAAIALLQVMRPGTLNRDGYLQRTKEIATSLLAWSLKRKKTFRHHLAVPLSEANSQLEFLR